MALGSKMTSCPHCGAANSEKKRICYSCQQEMTTVEEPKATSRLVPPPTQRPAVVRESVRPQQPLPPAVANTPRLRPTAPGLAATALSGASLAQRIQFFRQLHGMLHAGIPLTQSLHFLQLNISPVFRPVVRDIADNVTQGTQLSTVMARYANLFPEWEVSVVRASELSGSLPEAMAEIAATLEWNCRYASVSARVPGICGSLWSSSSRCCSFSGRPRGSMARCPCCSIT